MENMEIKIGQKVFLTGGACKGRYGIITRFLGDDEYVVLTDIKSWTDVYTAVEKDEFYFVE
jgi:ribosomal protein L24